MRGSTSFLGIWAFFLTMALPVFGAPGGVVEPMLTVEGGITEIFTEQQQFALASLDGMAWRVQVNAETLLFKNGAAVSFSDLQVSDPVFVVGIRQDPSAQTLLASTIEVRPITQWIHAEGPIASIDPGARLFRLQSGAPNTPPPIAVQVDDATQILSSAGLLLSFSDLQLNQPVAVDGEIAAPSPELTILARQILVFTDPPPPPVYFGGVVVEIDLQGHWFAVDSNVVPPDGGNTPPPPGGRVVLHVDEQSLFYRGDTIVSFESLRLGEMLRGEAVDSPETGLVATQVWIYESPPPPPQLLFGTVGQIQAEARTFELLMEPGKPSLQVHAAEDALILQGGVPVEFSGILAGQFVSVEGSFAPNGAEAFEAAVIQLDPPPPPVYFGGVVVEIDLQGHWFAVDSNVVPPDGGNPPPPGGRVVLHVDERSLFHRGDVPVAFESLRVGEMVWGEAVDSPETGLVATQAWIYETPPPSNPSGTVGQILAGARTFELLTELGAPPFQVHASENTVILQGDMPVEFSAILSGQSISVEGNFAPNDASLFEAAVIHLEPQAEPATKVPVGSVPLLALAGMACFLLRRLSPAKSRK